MILESPLNWTNVNKPANLNLVANATVPGGTISKVEFYADGFIFIGAGVLSGANQYSLLWSSPPAGKHVVVAVATDNNGVNTTSTPASINVNEKPVISLVSPGSGSVFSPAPANITLTANASDFDGMISKVDFFANGLSIGTTTAFGVNRFNFSWTNVSAGTYNVTAVATDSLNATTTSAPITVRVNAMPTVSMASPSNGTQFSTPANITVIANAADADGGISNVDILANGFRIGSGTAIGGGQYSFTWNNVGIGNYIFTAVATDNEGAVNWSGGTGATVTSPVLLVANSTTLNSTELAVKARLEALYHTVTVKSAASAVTADATGKALVVISSTVTPSAVGTKFRTVTVPVLTWESGIYNNMGMTGSTNKDFGTKTSQTQVTITNSSHALASGFSGNVTTATSGIFNWGKPNANASTVGIVVGDATKTLIFGYETGSVMPGLTAPARRVGFFMNDTTALNANGTALLDAAIRWGIGGGSLAGSFATSPLGLINLTSEGERDWTHWGLNGATVLNRKGGVSPLISNVTKIGTGGQGWFNDCPTSFGWSDGTPTLNMTSTATGIWTSGVVGNGFEINVPADANSRTVKFYAGLWYTQGKLEATLSDGSAPAYINSSLNNNGGSSFGVYTINFKAGAPGQTLKLRYTIQNQYFTPYGNVAVVAVTLQ